MSKTIARRRIHPTVKMFLGLTLVFVVLKALGHR